MRPIHFDDFVFEQFDPDITGTIKFCIRKVSSLLVIRRAPAFSVSITFGPMFLLFLYCYHEFTLICVFGSSFQGHLVEAAYNQLVQSGRIPPISIAKERFCYKLQQEDCLGAIASVRDLAAHSPDFSKKAG